MAMCDTLNVVVACVCARACMCVCWRVVPAHIRLRVHAHTHAGRRECARAQGNDGTDAGSCSRPSRYDADAGGWLSLLISREHC